MQPHLLGLTPRPRCRAGRLRSRRCRSPCFVLKMVSFRLVSFFCFSFVALCVMLFPTRLGWPGGCRPVPQLRAEPRARHEGPCPCQRLEKQSLQSGVWVEQRRHPGAWSGASQLWACVAPLGSHLICGLGLTGAPSFCHTIKAVPQEDKHVVHGSACFSEDRTLSEPPSCWLRLGRPIPARTCRRSRGSWPRQHPLLQTGVPEAPPPLPRGHPDFLSLPGPGTRELPVGAQTWTRSLSLHVAICRPFEVAAGDEGFGPWRPSERPPGWCSLHTQPRWEPRVCFKLNVGPAEAGNVPLQATGMAPAHPRHPFQECLPAKAEGPKEGAAVSSSAHVTCVPGAAACEEFGGRLARVECFRKCWP